MFLGFIAPPTTEGHLMMKTVGRGEGETETQRETETHRERES